METKISIHHDGTTYDAKFATIDQTILGFESHGILTVSLIMKGNGWGQSAGNRCLGNSEEVSLYFGQHVLAIMEVLGVRKWEDVKGKNVMVLYDEGRSSGRIVGIAYDNKVLDFDKHAATFG